MLEFLILAAIYTNAKNNCERKFEPDCDYSCTIPKQPRRIEKIVCECSCHKHKKHHHSQKNNKCRYCAYNDFQYEYFF